LQTVHRVIGAVYSLFFFYLIIFYLVYGPLSQFCARLCNIALLYARFPD